jgi:hypothetical protein
VNVRKRERVFKCASASMCVFVCVKEREKSKSLCLSGLEMEARERNGIDEDHLNGIKKYKNRKYITA